MELSALTALLLAGGLGTRLRSIAPVGPKSLAPVRGRPFLEYQLAWLQRQGIHRVVLCLGYASQSIIDHVGDGSRFGVVAAYSIEPAPLGTAGALALARHLVSSTALVMNGDTYYTDSLAPMLAQHHSTNAWMTIAVSAGGERSASGQIVTDASQRVLRFTEKSESIPNARVSAGLYLLEPVVLAAIPPARMVSLEHETIPALLRDKRPVYIYTLQGGFWDMGTPAGYAQLDAQLGAEGVG